MASSNDERRAEYVPRRKKFRKLMRQESLDGVIVNHPPDVYYLCGFSGSSGIVVLLRERGYFLTDFRYREQAALEITGLREVIYDRSPEEGVADVLRGRAGLRLGFDAAYMPYASVVAMRRHLKGKASIVPLKGSLTLLRARKSRLELSAIVTGIGIAQEAFKRALSEVGRDTSEMDLAGAVDAAARERGAERQSFVTIVASGPRSALVHAHPSHKKLRGATVVDWGVIYEGYCTDATRTVAFGRVPAALRKAHRLVLEAQDRAMQRIKPGVKASDIDRAAREVIEAAGLGDAFGHGLGHGVGLEVHERPYIGRASRDVIEEGMVFTNEPGIYLPGIGGVRVEDMLLVTAHGPELLTTLPRSLDPSDYL
ncbi:MAG: aminopeptidase P family protein [Actinobacteria bacterium]|jgi:Xaa-Pro aminopeptidase/Xaa-Pro dipeptidase|nr:MAG: aminopeptidase P family protein [Actinomycetota bacterium]